MIIKLLDDGLMICPETSFEESWLREHKPNKIFHKTGLSPADYIGLKIVLEKHGECDICGAKNGEPHKSFNDLMCPRGAGTVLWNETEEGD